MEPGELRQRVQIQECSDSRSLSGGNIGTWRTLDTVWAKVAPLVGRELVEAQQMHEQAQVKITLRHYPGLTAKNRIVFDES